MEYHSIYFNECPFHSVPIVCDSCKRTFYVTDDVLDNLTKFKLPQSSGPEYLCEHCAKQLDREGKINLNKIYEYECEKEYKEITDTTDLLDEIGSTFDDIIESVDNISSSLEDLSVLIREALGD